VTTVGQPSQEQAEIRGIRASGVMAQPTVDRLNQIARMTDAGVLKVSVQRTFPLDEAQTALEYRQAGALPGKIVLTFFS
jgi:NADPH:quinone reductase-like Zn-dependent oxidoreductase